MSMKIKMVPGMYIHDGMRTPHGIFLTVISNALGESVQFEYSGVAIQVPYQYIEELMKKIR